MSFQSFLLCFAGGMGFGAFIILTFVWLIGKSEEKKDGKLIPVNPELIEFWRKSIEQKEMELRYLKSISEGVYEIAMATGGDRAAPGGKL